jgi:hypothetical protein
VVATIKAKMGKGMITNVRINWGYIIGLWIGLGNALLASAMGVSLKWVALGLGIGTLVVIGVEFCGGYYQRKKKKMKTAAQYTEEFLARQKVITEEQETKIQRFLNIVEMVKPEVRSFKRSGMELGLGNTSYRELCVTNAG